MSPVQNNETFKKRKKSASLSESGVRSIKHSATKRSNPVVVITAKSKTSLLFQSS